MSNAIKVGIHQDPKDAPNYKEIGGYTGLTLDKAEIVKNGTISGKPTVDLILTDENGNRYVAMATGEILKSIGLLVTSTEHN